MTIYDFRNGSKVGKERVNDKNVKTKSICDINDRISSKTVRRFGKRVQIPSIGIHNLTS